MFDDTSTLRWPPLDGARAEQLMILLHGAGAGASSMSPVAEVLRRAFPQALLLAPEGDAIAGHGGTGGQGGSGGHPDHGGRGREVCQWFATEGIDHERSLERVAAVVPRLRQFVHAAQSASGVGPAATALVGFAQGATLALELSAADDGLAGRVLSFSGCYARLPQQAPRYTTLHFFHGADDAVIPAEHSRAALQRLGELRGDATLDIAAGVGHELAPALVQCALQRLRSHIPHRTWAAAMGAVPGLAERTQRDDAAD